MSDDPFTAAELEAAARAPMEADHAYDAYADATRRILAVLADLDGVMPGFLAPETHAGECWRVHAGCLAARIRATLTREDITDATT